MCYFALAWIFLNLKHHILMITSVPKAERWDHVKDFGTHSALNTSTQNCCPSDQRSDVTSPGRHLKSFACQTSWRFSLCTCAEALQFRQSSANRFVSHACSVCTSPEFRNESFSLKCLCWSTPGGLKASLMHHEGHSWRLLMPLKWWCVWCGTITPFFTQLSQSCSLLLCQGVLTTPISQLPSLSETGLTTNLWVTPPSSWICAPVKKESTISEARGNTQTESGFVTAAVLLVGRMLLVFWL